MYLPRPMEIEALLRPEYPPVIIATLLPEGVAMDMVEEEVPDPDTPPDPLVTTEDPRAETHHLRDAEVAAHLHHHLEVAAAEDPRQGEVHLARLLVITRLVRRHRNAVDESDTRGVASSNGLPKSLGRPSLRRWRNYPRLRKL